MAEKEGGRSSVDQTLSLGSQAWNVADGYTKIKILRHLVLLDRYENIALYGTDDMEELPYDHSTLSRRREEAIKRFLSTLRQLLGNVKFALKKDDRPKVTVYLDRIENVESVINGVSFIEENMITKEIDLCINEHHFGVCMKVLQTIKDEINFPINDAGLIFKGSDEIDLDKIMNDIVEGG